MTLSGTKDCEFERAKGIMVHSSLTILLSSVRELMVHVNVICSLIAVPSIASEHLHVHHLFTQEFTCLITALKRLHVLHSGW